MHQQLASAEGCMIVNVAVFVCPNMAVEQPEFVVFDQPIGVLQVDLSRSNRLDLGTR